MSIVVGVKKGAPIAIACETQSNYGSLKSRQVLTYQHFFRKIKQLDVLPYLYYKATLTYWISTQIITSISILIARGMRRKNAYTSRRI